MLSRWTITILALIIIPWTAWLFLPHRLEPEIVFNEQIPEIVWLERKEIVKATFRRGFEAYERDAWGK
jgi:hypothetical protein